MASGSSCYRLLNETVSFYEAIAICKELLDGAGPVMIDSPIEQQFVFDWASSRLGDGHKIWLGGRAFPEQNFSDIKFTWLNQKPLIFSNWDAKEPLFGALPEQFCGAMSLAKEQAGKWISIQCTRSATSPALVCEKPLDNKPRSARSEDGLNATKESNWSNSRPLDHSDPPVLGHGHIFLVAFVSLLGISFAVALVVFGYKLLFGTRSISFTRIFA